MRPDATMLAALHGELVSHPWRAGVVSSSDAYSLFVARSSAMGWLTKATKSPFDGSWGMNDAGQNPVSGPRPTRVAWFQVSLTEPIPAGRPLPVQAFLSCAGDAASRIGTLRLRALQLLLPVQSLDGSPAASAVMSLLQDTGWFADCDPRLKTRVRVTLDGGQDPAIRSAAPRMRQWMREIEQDVFSCDRSPSPMAEATETALESGVIDELWQGPPHHKAAFSGTLVEWSLDALGWLAAFLADASSQHGVVTPLMFTARPIP